MESSTEAEGYNGEERRRTILLSEEQLDAIAERAAKKVLQHFHIEVGKVTVRAGIYVLGSVCLALLAYIGFNKEILK